VTTWDGAARTWGSEVLSSTLANEEIRDPLLSVGGPWNTYTPTLTGSGSNPVIGATGNQLGKYIQAGKLIKVRVKIAFGSGSTYGSGSWSISLPVAMLDGNGVIGNASYLDSSASSTYKGSTYNPSGTSVSLGTNASPIAAVTPTAPFTWATGDTIDFYIEYEGA